MAMAGQIIDSGDFPAAMEGGDAPDMPDDQARALVLKGLIDSPNIAAEGWLEDDELGRIGERVKREYDIDVQSRADWKKRSEAGMKLAMQVAEDKTFPWPKAANVKFPLVTTAAIQFAARAYPAIVPGTSVVRGKVIGQDKDGSKRDRAARIGEHMSYQLTEEMEEWEEDTDRLLHVLPIVGTVFRKTWFDRVMGRNRSEMVPADKLVVNYWAKSFATVPRYTHEIELYPYEVQERVRSGIFRDVDLGPSQGTEKQPQANDDDAPHCFLEQYRRLDLDDDGYAEPYIVTLHKDTCKVVRIVANYDEDSVEVDEPSGQVNRIASVDYCTKYGFIPAPDGSFYDVGFASLLNPLNESVNTVINQLLDAGTLANAGGGFIGSGLRMGSGPITRKPGKWQPVNASGTTVRDNIVPHIDKEPSAVLFNLLGLLIEAGKDISSVKDTMLGDQQGANQTATTTLALVEQGQKVFSAIYKRIHRSLKSELKKLYRLNRIYMPPEAYFNVLDEPRAIAQKDYAGDDIDVVPVSDPTMVSDMQKLARAEFLMQFREDPAMDRMEITQRILEAASIDRVDEVMAKEQPGPTPEMIQAQTESKRVDSEIIERAANVRLIEAQIAKAIADALKSVAQAEAAEAGPQLDIYKAEINALLGMAKAEQQGQQAQQRANGPANGG
jgi:chaperonin GroES